MSATVVQSAHKSNAPSLIGKLLAVALDTSSTEAEATNAAARLVQVARSHGVTLPTLLKHFAVVQPSEYPPDDAEVVIGFGRYTGRSLGEILKIDPRYIRWLSTGSTKHDIQLAATRVIRWWEDRA